MATTNVKVGTDYIPPDTKPPIPRTDLNTTNLAPLSNELIAGIFEYLMPTDLAKTSFSCLALREIANSHPVWLSLFQRSGLIKLSTLSLKSSGKTAAVTRRPQTRFPTWSAYEKHGSDARSIVSVSTHVIGKPFHFCIFSKEVNVVLSFFRAVFLSTNPVSAATDIEAI